MENITSFEWSAVSAEAALFCGAVLAVLFEALFPKRGSAVCAFAVAAMIAAIALDLLAPVPELSFGGTLGGRGGFGVFITACALLSALLGFGYFAKGGARRCEFLAVLMICAAALSIFARSRNLMLSFVALECATVCLYVMAAWGRSRASSLEGAAKYLVISGVSGGLFLLGARSEREMIGDLLILIEEEPHAELTRDKNDLIYNLLLNFPTAALGGTVEIPTLDGKARVKIDAGTQPGKLLRLRGKGLPDINGYGRGDEIVNISVYVPETLNNAEREQLQKMNESPNFKPSNSIKEKIFKKFRSYFD